MNSCHNVQCSCHGQKSQGEKKEFDNRMNMMQKAYKNYGKY